MQPKMSKKVALVLAGGAARGAYEVGVLRYLVREVSDSLGYEVPLHILCGTSVGAINCAAMAAFADEPKGRVDRLTDVWANLDMGELLRPTTSSLLEFGRSFLGRGRSAISVGGLFEASPIEAMLRKAIPYERIDTHLRAGRIDALSASTTQVLSGRTVVFVQRRRARPAPWSSTPEVVPRAVRMRAVHNLASAAVPVMFPPVRIEGRYYCDGGLRQNIPLSPARRLGASAAIVVNPNQPRKRPVEEKARSWQEELPSPLVLLGKTLNALLLDRVENEIDRLRKINDFLAAGQRAYGQEFVDNINKELHNADCRTLRKMNVVHVRSSANIAELSAEFVRSSEFKQEGLLGRIMKRLAHGQAMREADVLSYVLFDGRFARQLIDLGEADAAPHHDEFCALFEALREPD
jgi:NTE family protein